MSNLLDKASIILTPTAYNNGEALCVKPSDGSGDFDFSRNSAATRVNAQGLVENVQILSSNLVQNGDFSEEGAEEVSNGSFSQEGIELITNGNFDTDSDWTKQASWSISGGAANYDFLSDAKYIRQTLLNGGFVAGKTYKINFEITSGTAYMNVNSNGGGLISLNTYSVGSYSIYVTASASGSDLLIYGRNTSGTAFSIDNVSVREVGQNWSLGSGWSIGEDKLNFTNVNGSSNQSSVFVIGKTYKITCDYVFTSGTRLILPYDGSNFNSDMVITTPSSAIGYTYYYTPLGGSASFMYSDGNGNGSITNISVKEVGQNWDLQTGWEIGDGVAIFDYDTSISKIFTSNLNLNLNNSYKLSFEIKNVLSGTPNIFIANSGGSVGYNGNYTNYSEGVHTLIFSPSSNQTTLSFFARYSDFSITNISVIEITDDTNLPRINYEGFSYQDVLGSEEIVNGGFDNGGANWGNVGNNAVFENSSVIFENNAKIYQNVVNDLSKEYNIEIEFSSISGNGIQLLVGNGNSFVSYSVSDIINNGNKINIAKESFIGSGILFIYSQNSSTSAVITNVSVKEYLGQEVVPDSGCGSWLFEPQSTNLITYSEDFSQSFWTKQASVTLDKGYLAPDGTYNATKISGVIGSSYVVSQGGILSSSSTKSIWAKTTSGTGVIHLGANQNQSNASFTVTNEWQRFEVTGTTTDVYAVDFRNASTTLSEVLVWGAQGENLSYATSYIPTNGESNGVTRNQDVCNNGGSLASINSTEGTLYAEISTLNGDSGSNRTISLSDSTNGNQIRFYFPINIESQIIIRVDVGGSTIYVFAYNIITSETPIKLAFRYSPNGMDFYVNGSLVSSSALVPSFTNNLNSLQFRRGDGQFGADFFGKTKALAVWKEALSDSELQSLTTI